MWSMPGIKISTQGSLLCSVRSHKVLIHRTNRQCLQRIDLFVSTFVLAPWLYYSENAWVWTSWHWNTLNLWYGVTRLRDWRTPLTHSLNYVFAHGYVCSPTCHCRIVQRILLKFDWNGPVYWSTIFALPVFKQENQIQIISFVQN